MRSSGHDILSRRRWRATQGSIVAALSLILLQIPGTLSAVGGAWTKGPGGYYFNLAFGSTTADNERGFRGEERPLYRDTLRLARGEIGISNFSLYHEFGWTDWLTSQASARYTVVVREADIIEPGMEGLKINESASGLGDIYLGLRARLPVPTESMAAALNLGWKVPIASATTEVPLGTGVSDFDAGLGLGYAFPFTSAGWGWVQSTASWRFRLDMADEFVWSLQLGLPIISTLTTELQLDGIESTADFQSAVEGDNQIALNRLVGSQNYLQLTGGLTYRLNDWTDITAKYTTTLDGINTLDAQTIAFGVAWKWDGSAGEADE